MLPNFLGIGAAKSATTWLARCLGEHPDVYMASQKEVNILYYDSFDGDLSDYESHFSGWQGQKAVGEVSVRYLNSLNAPERVKKYFPDARIFVSLRNPADQVYSHYWHLKRQNFHQPEGTQLPGSFEEALTDFPDLLISPAMYAMHLKKWLQKVNPDRMCVVIFDDIEARPLDTLAHLYRFLEVDDNFVPPSIQLRNSAVRTGTSPRSQLADTAGSFVYDTVARRFYGQLKKLIGVRRASKLKEVFHTRQVMEAMFQKQGYPELSRLQREGLIERFKPDIHELEELTGRNLSHWLKP